MASKTLIVGIGSTGAEIASRAIDRILTSLEMDRLPGWVEVVAFDTAVIDKEFSVERLGNARGIGLPQTEFEDFKLRPASLAKMDFERWSMAEPFRAMHASTDGVSNNRMVGRANFLYPRVFAQFESEILARLNRLKQISLQEELQKAGIVANQVNEAEFAVFVVGSLTGGTCSGSFIDAGYYLRELGKQFTPPGGDFIVSGIFSIPHQSYGIDAKAQRRMANVCAALTELNHFLTDGVEYHQLFPTTDRPIHTVGEAPFRSTMIVVPQGSDDAAVRSAHAGVGEYIAAAATSDMTQAVQQKITDPVGSLGGLTHKGRHLNFATIGTAVLEYPAELIRQACAERLIAAAIHEWLDRKVEPSAPESFLNHQNLTLAGLRQGLLAPPAGGTTLEELIERRLAWARGEIEVGNVGAIQVSKDQIEIAFRADSPVEGGLAPNAAISLMYDNLPKIKQRVLGEIQQRIDSSLAAHNEGPNWCKRFLEILIARCDAMQNERADVSAHEVAAEMERAVTAQSARVREAAHDTFALWRKGALAHVAPEWHAASTRYWRQRMSDACGTVEADLVMAIRSLATKALRRVCGSDNPRSLVRILANDEEIASRAADRLAGTPPTLNGIVLFDGQVDREYVTALEQMTGTGEPGLAGLHGEAFARAHLITKMPALAGTLYGSSSVFEPGVHPQSGDEQAVDESVVHEQLSRAANELIFGHIKKRNVLELLYHSADSPSPQAQTTVQKLWDLSRPMADIDEMDSPLPPVGDTVGFYSPAFAFYAAAGSTTFPAGNFASDLSKVPASQQIRSRDVSRVTILRARVGFAAQQIKALAEYTHWASWWRGHSNLPLHARRDIVWYPIDGSDLKPGLQQAMDLFLLGLATGAITRTHLPDAPYELEILQDDDSRTTLRLSEDIERSGYELLGGETNDTSAEVALRRKMARLSADHVRPILVANAHNFVGEFEVKFRDLIYRGRPLQKGFVRDRIRRGLDYCGALESYYRTYPPRNAETPESYLRVSGQAGKYPDGRDKPAGYYCNGSLRDGTPCGYFVLSDTAAPNEVLRTFPDRCPNCGKQLLTPGLKRFQAWLIPLIDQQNGVDPAPQLATVATVATGPDLGS